MKRFSIFRVQARIDGRMRFLYHASGSLRLDKYFSPFPNPFLFKKERSRVYPKENPKEGYTRQAMAVSPDFISFSFPLFNQQSMHKDVLPILESHL